MGNDRISPEVRLRLAKAGDCLRIWRWRNEAEVRKLSFNTKKIPYALHRDWFTQRLASPKTKILIGENGLGRPFGQVRLDISKNRIAEVHILVKKFSRNKGLGQALLAKACRYGFDRLHLKKIVASVLPHNGRSIRLFEKLGFRGNKIQIKNQPALIMSLTRLKKGS